MSVKAWKRMIRMMLYPCELQPATKSCCVLKSEEKKLHFMRNFKANYKDKFWVKINTNFVKNSSNNHALSLMHL